MPIRSENRSCYPADWKLRRRFVCFVRARGRCKWCGAEHGKPHPITGSIVVLTTAHVFDHRPEAASLLNLAALCQRCHNRHDAPMRRQSRRDRGQTLLDLVRHPFGGRSVTSHEATECPRARAQK